MSGNNEPKPRLIKRYTNRKLYDTRGSCYITLQGIASLVHDGEEVEIIDNDTKEDLTTVTLAQVLVEEEKRSRPSAQRHRPSAFRILIQQGGDRILSTLGLERPLADGSKGALEGLHKLADDGLRELLGLAVARVQHLQAEVSRLTARIEDLERRLSKKPDGDG